MLDPHDRELLMRSQQTAHLLVEDLRELVRADQPLLAEHAQDLLRSSAEINHRLSRLLKICKPSA